MANFLGNLSVFDNKIHEWEVFYGKLTQFIKLNTISISNQSAVLLTHPSDKSYRLVRNLVHPDKLEEITYSELVQVLNGHFTPKRWTFADRAKFYEAIKSDSETIKEWAARLRGLAVYCEFGTELDTVLRDRFVLGFRTGHERDKLFERNSKTLTLAEPLEVALKASCARQARAGAVVVKEEPVFYVRGGRCAQCCRPGHRRSGLGRRRSVRGHTILIVTDTLIR
ncbi:reverse transcriptase [Operophtera brumata]|uniref:Reverse transcriptase n=1 Tax=Operophtera brumata TaxID=104452 RepID=A0A0L7LPZ4_OPEBR|nr:reverse transcriptase [Operophtera brumata]